jgi:DMSO/TMAO reductase YedYZ molybdopterin-dependent catalytic subunit
MTAVDQRIRPVDRRTAALIGVAAVAAALGVGELVALLTGPLSSPVVAVGGVVVDNVPEPVKHLAITLFGTHDKLALQLGTLILLGAAGAGLGLLAVRRQALSVAGVVLFGLIGALAAATRHNAGAFSVLPSLIGAAAAAAVLGGFTKPSAWRLESAGPASPTDADRPDPDRRQVLRLAAIVLGAGGAVAVGARWFGARNNVSAERAAVNLPAPANAASGLAPDADLQVARLASFVTPNPDFYRIDTALVVPQVAPKDWRLRIHGRVGKPLSLTYDQLLARPMIERYVTLACVSNEVGGTLIGNARWQGVRISDLLAEAEPDPAADQVVSRSVDGFTAGTPTAVLRDGRDAILAVGMNGEPLPIEHGFPVRMVVPGLYGYVSATKWLAELELTTFGAFDAYWIDRGWAQQAPIKLESRIDTPRTGAKVKAGQVAVAGVAWQQHVGVSAVELRVDDGPWQPARLSAVPSIDTWRQWTVAWAATPGKHRLSVRAHDTAGTPQTDAVEDPFPSGATGYHTVEVTVE